ncbi:MAG: ABC transporter ATP-binding protein [Chitinispirillaceae bacterium]|nr:ABC transporter ATP-binding protein [Chitinispirillaceae bacterium]
MLLAVENLEVAFHLRNTAVRAVRSVSFELEKGETIGIVGESGSGKTVLAHSILRLVPHPPARTGGRILFDGDDLLSCSAAALRGIRGNRICMIFQDPSASFNPYLRLADQLMEPLLLHRSITRAEALDEAVAALGETGIAHPAERIRSFPHEFSGGMLQRAMIAMALMMRPQIVLADEPTTALDVTVQAQLLRLMRTLREQYAMTVVFITHNLGIVAGFCDRVLVMYAGVILESAPTGKLFSATAHPYTRALIRSVPRLQGTKETLSTIPGAPPDPSVEHTGCPFYPRCDCRIPECGEAPVRLVEIDEGHATSCIRFIRGDMAW